MSKKIGLIDIQTVGEPTVVGFIDNYAGDQIMTLLTHKQAKDINDYNKVLHTPEIDVDVDVREYIENK